MGQEQITEDEAAEGIEALFDTGSEVGDNKDEATSEEVDEEVEDSGEEPDEDTEPEEGEEEDEDSEEADVKDEAGEDPDEKSEFTVKVNGEERQVSEAELIKNYQLETSLQERARDLADERKTFDESKSQAVQAVEERVLALDTMVREVGQLPGSSPQELAELKQEDPEAYANMLEAIEDRKALIKKAYGARQAAIEDAEGKAKEIQDNWETQQNKLLYDSIPEWSDPKVATSEGEAMYKYLEGMGFSVEDMGQLKDHRFIQVARDAALGKKMDSVRDTAKKKIKRAKQKPVRPGVGKGKAPNAKTKAALQLRQKATASRDPQDVEAAIEAML